ncbi:uncharacterized protein LOC110271428 [Arachis ipaensis]|uniref:uncharacterized protein LOC110271428 n=1 Tax=Arachis ipaensis TaxID=130454 RepID=UPI000A2B7E41|nr:uncharacterized protein LOC110271428 [Arachis ipaensis]
MSRNSRNSSSATWKKIVSVYEHLKEGLHWNIENVHKSVWYDEWTPFGKLCNLVPYVHISESDFIVADLWKGVTWEVDSLTTPIPHEIKQFICEKFKFTIWLGLHDALPTETFRFKRHLASSDMCKRCNKVQKTIEHCLRDCERSNAIWHMLDPSILDSTASTALEEWFWKALANNEASFGAGLWWVRRHRCNDIFNTDNPWTDHKVVALARITDKDLQVYRNRNNAFRCELFATWKGLVLAWDCGLRDIICEMDCFDILLIMHNLISGYSYEVTDLVYKIQEILSRPWLVHIEWVSWEANRAADWMARYGTKSNSNNVIWSEPCVDL